MGRESDAQREARLRQAGDWLRAERERRGWSQHHLARLIDVAQQQVSQYEKGRYEVGGDIARELAAVFRLSERQVWEGLRLAYPQEQSQQERDQALIDRLAREHPEALKAALRRALRSHDGRNPHGTGDRPTDRVHKSPRFTRKGDSQDKAEPDEESAV